MAGDFLKVFGKPITKCWIVLLGVSKERFAKHFLDGSVDNFNDKVADKYGVAALDILNELAVTDYEADKSIKDDVSYD